MRVRGENLGILTVLQHGDQRPPLDEFDREIATHLANLAGFAIANARLFRRVGQENAERLSAESIATQLRASEAEALLARDAAQAANTELEAFSYAVSPDLRAPLRAIDGFSQALLEDFSGPLGETGRGYALRVRNAAKRMSSLIDDLLKLSQVTRTSLRRHQVDLGELFRASCAFVQNLEPERHVEIVVAPELRAYADPKLLAIAFDNLVSNAWKFTVRNPNPRVELSVSHLDGERVFCVSDNGVGFDMTYSHKLFGVFNRLHADGDFPGTGVGLATVSRIIARHGGRVWADGEVGRGARFFFTVGDTKGPS
jgi:light-regulated signal transduction histidine kinase (bacteriophytochrome)